MGFRPPPDRSRWAPGSGRRERGARVGVQRVDRLAAHHRLDPSASPRVLGAAAAAVRRLHVLARVLGGELGYVETRDRTSRTARIRFRYVWRQRGGASSPRIGTWPTRGNDYPCEIPGAMRPGGAPRPSTHRQASDAYSTPKRRAAPSPAARFPWAGWPYAESMTAPTCRPQPLSPRWRAPNRCQPGLQ